jgi:hypothetical protein
VTIVHDCSRRPHRARGASALKLLLILALLGALGYAGAYVNGWMRVASAEGAFSRRLTEAGRVNPAVDTVAPDLVRRRLVAIAQEEGVTVAPEEIEVVIAPLDADNIEKLAAFERAALGIANKLPNHQIDALFLGIKATVHAKWGPVKRVTVVERSTWVHKSMVR